MNLYDIDFNQLPYRGVFSEVAREKKVSASAVLQGFRRKSPKYTKPIREKVIERLKQVNGEIDVEAELKEAV